MRPQRSCLILLPLVGAALAGLVLIHLSPSVIALGDDAATRDETVNEGQAKARAALETHRDAHRSRFDRVVQVMPTYAIGSGDRTSIVLLSLFADPIQVRLTAYNHQGRPYPLLDHVSVCFRWLGGTPAVAKKSC